MNPDLTRRDFLGSSAAALGSSLLANGAVDTESPADKAVKALYDSLSEPQRKLMCHDWDKKGYGKYPLRLHVTNNWAVSNMAIGSLTKEQQVIVEDISRSVLHPDWPVKLHQQAKDDTGNDWTRDRKIAIFGTPGSDRCQCVISGFHLTFRAGKAKDSPVAFGGAICHGHQPSGFHEKPGHPGNIFWYQAQEAHKVYQILDGKLRKKLCWPTACLTTTLARASTARRSCRRACFPIRWSPTSASAEPRPQSYPDCRSPR